MPSRRTYNCYDIMNKQLFFSLLYLCVNKLSDYKYATMLAHSVNKWFRAVHRDCFCYPLDWSSSCFKDGQGNLLVCTNTNECNLEFSPAIPDADKVSSTLFSDKSMYERSRHMVAHLAHSKNRQTIRTREQAFQYSFRMQWHNKCPPIIILLCQFFSIESRCSVS